jgi:hypothetical protein
MFVGGLVLDPNTQAPVVVLKDESGNIALPIWIGVAEATSIASAIKQLTMQRPLTHDLMQDSFDKLGVKVQRIVITDLKDSTYFAELIVSQGDRVIALDARPSDAIGIALRAEAPIFVAQQVLDQAKMSFSLPPGAGEGAPPERPEDPAAADPGKEGAPVEASPEEQDKDFRHIDKDKWNEILSELDPDDFKYKM